MATRKIITRGDPVLGKRAHPVTKFDERVWTLLDDMGDTLRESGGVGLAAPQVGILRRVVVVLTGEEGEEELLELINPEIVASEGTQTGFEGCLSVPGYYGKVTRPMKATVRAQDRKGNWFEHTGEGLTARCFCHELDHLDGKLYTELVEGRLYTAEELDEMREREE